LWDACTGMLICKLPKFHRVGVRHICFSADGRFIASMGMDEDNSIAVWRRRQNAAWTLQCHGKAQKEKGLFIAFTEGEEYQIMTGGVSHATFWRIKGHSMNRAPGLFGKKGKLQTIICACPVRGNVEKGARPNGVITGTQDGHLYKWEGRNLVLSILAHDKSINSVFATALGIVSGGSDGFVKLWNYDFGKIEEYNMRDSQRPSPPDVCVKSVCWNTGSSKILVGSRSSEIYEISLNTKTFLLLNESHHFGQTAGLQPHPSNPDIFVTGGDDCTVRVWDAASKAVIKKATIDSMTRAVAWSPDGKFIAVGLGGKGSFGSGQKKDGAYVVLDAKTMGVVQEDRKSKLPIRDIKYSPEGEILAVASEDGKIYLHETTKNFTLRGICTLNDVVSHIDFSVDGGTIQCTSEDKELQFVNVEDASLNPSAASCKDHHWLTWTCPYGWPVQGIWPQEADGIKINAVYRSNKDKYVATVDEAGLTKIFNFPCLNKGVAQWVEGRGHSTQVKNVCFNKTGSRLFTVGGNDRAIFQWKIMES